MQKRSGTLLLGSSPELFEAFDALLKGLRAGRSDDELRPYYKILGEAVEAAEARLITALALARLP
jgi:hypothetical protein